MYNNRLPSLYLLRVTSIDKLGSYNSYHQKFVSYFFPHFKPKLSQCAIHTTMNARMVKNNGMQCYSFSIHFSFIVMVGKCCRVSLSNRQMAAVALEAHYKHILQGFPCVDMTFHIGQVFVQIKISNGKKTILEQKYFKENMSILSQFMWEYVIYIYFQVVVST